MDSSIDHRTSLAIDTQEDLKPPFRYQAFSATMAFFPARISRLQSYLPDPRLKLIPLIPGFSAVGIACLEYEACDLGPYNEVGIFFPVRYQPRLNLPLLPLLFEESFKDAGTYIHRLPVTTQTALDTGQRFWGYPKCLANIEFEDRLGWRTGRWTEGGQLVLELSVEILKPSAPRQRILRTFSVLEGRWVTATFEMRGALQVTRRSNRARLTLGSHPYAEEIKAWELSPAAIETRFCTQMQGQLNAPQPAEPGSFP